MQSDRADGWWSRFARITFYLAAWISADLAAFAVRSPQGGLHGGLTRWLWDPLSLKVVLLVLLVPRRASERSERLALVACASIGVAGATSIAFWARADISRAFMALDFVFSAAAMLVASAIVRRVQGEDQPPSAERAR